MKRTYQMLAIGIAIVGLHSCDHPTGTGEPHPSPSLNVTTLGGEVLFHRYLDNTLDESGQHNDGTALGGPTFVAGEIERAIALDGTDDFVLVPADASLHPTTVSVEACIRPSVTLTTGFKFVPLVVKLSPTLQFGARVDGYDLTFQDETDRGGRVNIVFGIGANGGHTRVPVKVETDLEASLFHHLVGTYDGAEIRLYVNGVLGNVRVYDVPIAYLGGPVKIGGNVQNLIQVPSGALSYFAGDVEEVAIFSRALTESEVVSRSRRCIGNMTPEELLDELRSTLEAFLNQGTLNGGQFNALTRKLDSATRFLNKGNPNGAANVLGAFQNQVASLEDEGVLSTGDAATLTMIAQDVIDQIAAG